MVCVFKALWRRDYRQKRVGQVAGGETPPRFRGQQEGEDRPVARRKARRGCVTKTEELLQEEEVDQSAQVT